MNADRSGDDARDENLLIALGRAVEAADPVPETVLVGARAAFVWRTIDAELAEIAFDSAEDLAGVRGDEVNRQVTFRAPGVEIEVMVIDNGSRRLVGQLVPPASADVVLHTEDGEWTVSADRLGRFAFDDLRPGRARLAILGAEGQRLVQTEWVTL